ncbi:NIPSNAP family protein [Nakamurella leprariae]|uniref:NIPSNAP family protein n=1 Tax=Nakamurella leprariae TaxID=2803911 RepID=A0A938YFR1_9ACTN|nr:NIPSNAP family protein [Nakamurella leprariae]MBM9468711.1 NIPSNAP family protein [Nakamurella leprariae]
MLVEMRTYTIKPGRVDDFLSFYERHGWALQQQYLGTCLGWYSSKDGPLFQVVHLWAYQDYADRERRRDALYRDPAWVEYFDGVSEQGLLLAAENKFLSPTGFSPVPALPA